MIVLKPFSGRQGFKLRLRFLDEPSQIPAGDGRREKWKLARKITPGKARGRRQTGAGRAQLKLRGTFGPEFFQDGQHGLHIPPLAAGYLIGKLNEGDAPDGKAGPVISNRDFVKTPRGVPKVLRGFLARQNAQPDKIISGLFERSRIGLWDGEIFREVSGE